VHNGEAMPPRHGVKRNKGGKGSAICEEARGNAGGNWKTSGGTAAIQVQAGGRREGQLGVRCRAGRDL